MTEQANSQTRILERDIQQLRDSQDKMNARFDRHLEIYSQNGKELSALKSVVASLEKTIERAVQKDDGLDSRVNKLQIEQSKLITKVAMVVGVVSFIASTIGSVILLNILS